MNPVVISIDQKRDLFFNLIEGCNTCKSETDFCTFVHPALSKILPHRMFAAGLGFVSCDHFHRVLAIGFTPEISARINLRSDGTKLPLLDRWRQQPRMLHQTSWVVPERRLHRRDGQEHSELALSNLCAHGHIQITTFTYFVFAGMTSRWDDWQSHLFELSTPYLSAALLNISNSMNTQPNKTLSRRELEILRWVSMGKSNSEIAELLNISSWTVKIHIANLMRKMGVRTRTQAIAKAMTYGMLRT